ncbi:IMPACT family protein [Gracilimonas tropica]|uniref:IMPACT family protein n=1 Tax=Gracilimonas tropica TaxID=454600 RepID=UPI00037CD33B|nr:YigZ family protein [Gracilimonas tropica]
MKTITKTYETSFRERGSKFIGFLFPVETEDDFQDQLDQLKSRYPDATHHCWAWRLNPAQPKEFSSDDGEPSGTAGLPILNQLKSFEAVNAGMVVVRYYGGTKLGKPGLIEAYGRSTQLCLESARLIDIRPVKIFEIRYSYSEENTIQKLINDFDLKVTESEYLETVRLKVACPLETADACQKNLAGLEHLKIEFSEIGKSYI